MQSDVKSIKTPSINHNKFVFKGKTAASGERTRKGNERDGAGDVAEGKGSRTFQNLG